MLLKLARNRYTVVLATLKGTNVEGGWVFFGAGWVLRKEQYSQHFLRLTGLFPALHFQTVGGKAVWEEAWKKAHLE